MKTYLSQHALETGTQGVMELMPSSGWKQSLEGRLWKHIFLNNALEIHRYTSCYRAFALFWSETKFGRKVMKTYLSQQCLSQQCIGDTQIRKLLWSLIMPLLVRNKAWKEGYENTFWLLLTTIVAKPAHYYKGFIWLLSHTGLDSLMIYVFAWVLSGPWMWLMNQV